MKVSGYLESLSPEERAALEPYLQARKYPRGAHLFDQGSAPEAVFILVAGCAKVTCSWPNGRELITELLFPGDVCGGLCGVHCSSLGVSAVAMSRLQTYRIPLGAFEQLASRHPALLTRAVDCCRRKFRDQREMLTGIAFDQVEQRAARGLLMIAGEPDADGRRRLRVSFTRREFADLIGSAVESAIRVLGRLRSRGLVNDLREGSWLPNPRGLEELARRDPPPRPCYRPLSVAG